MAETRKGKSPKEFAGMFNTASVALRDHLHDMSPADFLMGGVSAVWSPLAPWLVHITHLDTLGCCEDIRCAHRAYQAFGSEPG